MGDAVMCIHKQRTMGAKEGFQREQRGKSME